MKVVIPVSHSDSRDLPPLVNILLKHGHIGQHSILLVPTPSCAELAHNEAVRLRTICEKVEVAVTPVEYAGGWPVAPNNHWHWTVTYLDGHRNRDPWIWLEVDAVPLAAGWVNQIEEDYRRRGKPFYGFVKPLKFFKTGSEEVYHKPGEDMLMGVAVYPPGISADIHIAPLFNNLGARGRSAQKQPFDMYLRWVFKHRGVYHSPLIQDLWRTENYRHQGSAIVCDPLNGEKFARGGTVSPEALLVHGVKDGSLQRLMLGEVERGIVKLLEDEVKPGSSAELAKANEILRAVVQPAAAPVVETAPTASPVSPDAVLAFISAKSVRFSDVRKEFPGIAVQPLVELIQGLGYHLVTGNWVKKKEGGAT
jgi:hypothetical protein